MTSRSYGKPDPKAFDVRVLVGLSERRDSDEAARHRCVLLVVSRDGRQKQPSTQTNEPIESTSRSGEIASSRSLRSATAPIERARRGRDQHDRPVPNRAFLVRSGYRSGSRSRRGLVRPGRSARSSGDRRAAAQAAPHGAGTRHMRTKRSLADSQSTRTVILTTRSDSASATRTSLMCSVVSTRITTSADCGSTVIGVHGRARSCIASKCAASGRTMRHEITMQSRTA